MQNIANILKDEEKRETRKHIDEVTEYFDNPRYFRVEEEGKKEFYAVYFGIFTDKRDIFIRKVILAGILEEGRFQYIGEDITFSQKRVDLDLRLHGPEMLDYLRKGRKDLPFT